MPLPTSPLLLLILFFPYATPFDCYKCTSTIDELCITNPEAISSGDVTVTNCMGYCTIVRTEFTDVPEKVISLTRDCELKPLVINEIRTDAHYTKYFRSCTTNKCNGGDGVFGGGGGGGRLPNELIRVPEKSHSVRLGSCFNLILLFLLKLAFVL